MKRHFKLALQKAVGLSVIWLLGVSMTVVGLSGWWHGRPSWLPAMGIAILVLGFAVLFQRERK